eukprot:3341673-Rhodomonas_salina.2
MERMRDEAASCEESFSLHLQAPVSPPDALVVFVRSCCSCWCGGFTVCTVGFVSLRSGRASGWPKRKSAPSRCPSSSLAEQHPTEDEGRERTDTVMVWRERAVAMSVNVKGGAACGIVSETADTSSAARHAALAVWLVSLKVVSVCSGEGSDVRAWARAGDGAVGEGRARSTRRARR